MPPVPYTESTIYALRQNQPGGPSDTDNIAAEPDEFSRSSKKKKRDKGARQQPTHVSQSYLEKNAGIIGDAPYSASPLPSSVLSQIPSVFQTARRVNPLSEETERASGDDDDDGSRCDHASRQKLVPTETWSSPPAHRNTLRSGLSAEAPQPIPIEAGFSERGGFSTRSPPVSPPLRHARPVSYGGGMPLKPPYSRMSSSPYSQPPSLYGSPPAPHMPQQHFYHARDVDIGLARGLNTHNCPDPTLVKHVSLPHATPDYKHGILLGFDRQLNVLSTCLNKFEEIGVLTDLPGTVVDAAFLAWDEPDAHDPFSALRPLIAITTYGPKPESRHVDNRAQGNGHAIPVGIEYITSVNVYSLAQQRHLIQLLDIPAMVQHGFGGSHPSVPAPTGALKLYTAGKYLAVACNDSGEILVFTVPAGQAMRFECLGKFWTTLQPQLRRRDSSHSRASDVDNSPTDPNRGTINVERAIVDLSGRWLVICPASLPCRPSAGVQVGEAVFCRKNAGLESATAPSRPPITTEVDSPDADTLLGKVARGVAQELVKGAKWLGDQGYQTWQNYWRKEQVPQGPMTNQQLYGLSAFNSTHMPNLFPPTHGDSTQVSKEAEVVSVFDLKALEKASERVSIEELGPAATFRPPRGCSFVSFAPHGLTLLTAGRRGDVQYVWDLMQVQHTRILVMPNDDDPYKSQPRVRQIGRFERLSGSTIVDVVWEGPQGHRFAVLTANRTVHIYDLPRAATRWPPPRSLGRAKAIARPGEGLGASATENGPASSFLASAINIASKAPPMVTNWRGRAPSISGGLAGISAASIGIASATGARGGKAVAAGLSKSLGAASETVQHLRHAGESRLHLKSKTQMVAGKLVWHYHRRRSMLVVLDAGMMRSYHVRSHRNADKQSREAGSSFDIRKPANMRLPPLRELHSNLAQDAQLEPGCIPGLWMPRRTITYPASDLRHPLSMAEIETNAPYQPFHSDRRVVLSVFPSTSSASGPTEHAATSPQWVFGDELPTVLVRGRRTISSDDEDIDTGSVIYRQTTKASLLAGDDLIEQIVSTTRRSRKKRTSGSPIGAGREPEKDDFFEDDCEVLDFATDRV